MSEVPKDQELENIDFEPTEIYELDGEKYFVDDMGDIYKVLEYDINDDQSQEPENVDETLVEEQEADLGNHDLTDSDLETNVPEKDNAIKNKMENENDLVETTEIKSGTEDLDPYQETSENKPDGAFSMMERNIAECQRLSNYKKSREECAKEVKKKMADKDMPIVETSDLDEDKDKTDTVEICSKELDMLREKAKKLEKLEKDYADLKDENDNFKADFLAFKKKMDDQEAAELEVKRQDLIKKISYDFEIPTEELAEDSMLELEKLEKRLGLALKRETAEEAEDMTEDEDMEDITADAIHKRYFVPC